ncbi:Ctr copper transporter, partial [Athelia psychrophila]
HGGHGDMPTPTPMPRRCSMNMLWNTQIEDTCIVFPGWHIRSSFAFALSFLAIVALGVLYEYLRVVRAGLDRRVAADLRARGREVKRSRSGGREREMGRGAGSPEAGGEGDAEEAGLISGRRVGKAAVAIGTPIPAPARAQRALLYGVTIFLSFFLMLVFMTYNAYLILAVVLGGAIGHFVFEDSMDVEGVLSGAATEGRGMACH